MKISVVLGKKTFEAIADKEALLRQVDATFPEFEEGAYRTFEGGEDDIVTEEEFNENLADFKKKIEEACEEEYLREIVDKMPKKKNGTFYKGRKYVVDYYNNTEFFTEWHNTWGTFELRFCSISDLVVELQILKYNHTPG